MTDEQKRPEGEKEAKRQDSASESGKKPMSKLEQARAADAAKKAEEQKQASGAAASDEGKGAEKPMSKLEQARAAAAKKGGAKPTGGKSKLEAARAGGAPGKGAAGGSKLAAARASGAAGATKPGEKAPPKKPLPPKPTRPAPKGAKKGGSRRFFVFTWIGAAWTFFTLSCAAALAGTARFFFPNVDVEPPSKFKIGVPDDYPPNSVATQWKAKFQVWIVNTTYNGQQEIYALRTVCTHLGCTPNWLESEQKFKCPCHGSGFYINGINFEGPAPRPLERFAIRLAEDGQLQVDKSRLFQEEMGQWEDPASYVAV